MENKNEKGQNPKKYISSQILEVFIHCNFGEVETNPGKVEAKLMSQKVISQSKQYRNSWNYTTL